MGGFVLDYSRLGPNAIPGQRKRFILTAAGALKLADLEQDMIPDIDPDQIRDKGKADASFKSLAWIQALWFVTQAIVRLGTGYPLSVLEITTFARALCCLAVYCL